MRKENICAWIILLMTIIKLSMMMKMIIIRWQWFRVLTDQTRTNVCFVVFPYDLFDLVWFFFIRIQELNWFKQSPSSSLLPEISMSWLRCLFVCFYHRNNYLLNDEHWFIHLFNDSLNFCLSQCPILWWFKSIFFLSFLFFHYSFATIYSLNCVSCV